MYSRALTCFPMELFRVLFDNGQPNKAASIKSIHCSNYGFSCVYPSISKYAIAWYFSVDGGEI